MQYTIRNIPPYLDEALRARAHEKGKSLNEVTLEALQAGLESESVHLPVIVVGELRAGFALGRKGRENEAVLQRFLMKPGVEVLYPTDATTRHYANLFRQLRHQGTPIPTNGLWIAALVLEHNLVLCSRDGHFRSIPQLNIA